MYSVFYTNHWYYAEPTFDSVEDALSYAKSKGFDAAIMKPYNKNKPYAGGEQIGYWSIIGGFHDLRSR